MGCCGCSLVSSTTSAGIYSIILSTVTLCLGTLAMIMMTEHDTDTSNEPSSLKTSFQFLETDSNVHIPLLIVSLSLDVLWLLTSILLLVGNKFNKIGNKLLLIPWILVALVVILFDTGCGSYYSFRLFAVMEEYGYSVIQRWSALIFLCFYYGRGGIFFLCAHVSFIVFVIRRYKEISRSGLTVRMGPALQPLPYTNSYQAYPSGPSQYNYHSIQQDSSVLYDERLSVSPNQRPPTPPPDYDVQSFDGLKTKNHEIVNSDNHAFVPDNNWSGRPKDYNEKY